MSEAEQDGGVDPSETCGDGEPDPHVLFSHAAGNIVQITLWVGFVIVDRRRDDPIPKGQDGENGFGAPGEGYIRMTVCTSKERLTEAVERIRKAGF